MLRKIIGWALWCVFVYVNIWWCENVCVCVFNQTVKAGNKLILGWSCDSNIKHMGKIETKKKQPLKHVAVYPKGDLHLE